jgi:hypothetical protein
VTRIDELKVEEFLLARHGKSLGGDFKIGRSDAGCRGDTGIPACSLLTKARRTGRYACVTGEIDPRLLAGRGLCLLRPCLQLTCMI